MAVLNFQIELHLILDKIGKLSFFIDSKKIITDTKKKSCPDYTKIGRFYQNREFYFIKLKISEKL